MSDVGGDSQEALARRVAALEEVVAELQDEIRTAVHRDLPLLKGTVRGMAHTDIETVHEFPDAGRAVGERLAQYDERLSAVERQLDAVSDIDDEPSSKKAKFAAVLAFAANKRSGNGKVALSPHEIKGCTGVSRRYAYELIETMAGCIDGVGMREAHEVQTGSGTARKGKALLVDCDVVHSGDASVNQFTTDATGEGVAETE